MFSTPAQLAAWFRARCGDDRAASLIEYALLLVLIALVCIVAVGLLGEDTFSGLNRGGSEIQSATN